MKQVWNRTLKTVAKIASVQYLLFLVFIIIFFAIDWFFDIFVKEMIHFRLRIVDLDLFWLRIVCF